MHRLVELRNRGRERHGNILVMFVILLPALLGLLGLVLDGGLLMADFRQTQQAADAAATAAAMELRLGKSEASASATATEFICVENGLPDAQVVVNIPPSEGNYAGRPGFVETIATRSYRTFLIHLAGGGSAQGEFKVRAVAGTEASTSGAAIVVLDPDPAPLTVPAIPLALPVSHPLLAGLEVLGLGTVRVDGAVLVNTAWGGVDQNGNPAGQGDPPPYGVMCTSLLPLTRLQARDIRVSGGVDDAANYGHFQAGEDSPLEANRLPVPDPLLELPAPTVGVDAQNVRSTLHGGVRVAGLPLIGPPVVLQPGVYEWIEIVSGSAIFEPGVYVIRNVNPLTQIALNVLAGEVTAEGVMFYITNSPEYDVTTGQPDADDGDAAPLSPEVLTLVPSVVINATLLNSTFAPLNDGGSPFDGMIIYQRRWDRRPIVIAHENLVGGGSFAGITYAKWGHVTFVARGTYDARFVTGTLRIITALGCTLAPSELLPPAEDVYLVE